MSGNCSQQENIGPHHANPVITKQRKWSSQENEIAIGCYLLSEPKNRGYRKCMLSLWLNEGLFWISEQRLVDQASTIRRSRWMTELEIEELERNLAENDIYKEEERSADDVGSNLGEDVGDILTALEADEEISNLEEEEVAIIEEMVKVLERNRKTSYQLLH